MNGVVPPSSLICLCSSLNTFRSSHLGLALRILQMAIMKKGNLLDPTQRAAVVPLKTKPGAAQQILI